MDKTCIIIEWDGATAKATMYGSEYKLKYSASKTNDQPDMQKSILRVVEKLVSAVSEPPRAEAKFKPGTVVLTKTNNVVQIDYLEEPHYIAGQSFLRGGEEYIGKKTDVVYKVHFLFSANGADLNPGDSAYLFQDDISEVFK